MNLIHSETEDNLFRLVFQEQEESNIEKQTVEFELEWKHDEQLIARKGDVLPFPYDMNKELISLSIHIPDESSRRMFKECFDYFIRIRKPPINVAQGNYPGYPLLVVTYSKFILNKNELELMIDRILEGMKGAVVEHEEIEVTLVEEDEDEVNEDMIVEYEEDEELKKLLKPVQKEIVLPLEGD